ncbi:M48 family metalloprotease [Actinoplanes sp. NPDC024001]|uniref:M48 family metalloprotease n=1 Tax=Actinoplanes sp. NPDC024001 TaxID=3154598 RepID=UPI0033D3FF77
MAGALLTFALAVAFAWLLPRRLLRRLGPLRPAPGPLRDRAAAIAAQLGVRRAPAVEFGPWHLCEPFTVRSNGATRIVLPPGARRLPQDRLDAVLRHETAHLAAGDVTLVWLTRSALWALPVMLPVPLLVAAVDGGLSDRLFWLEYLARAAVLWLAAYLLARSVMRAREHEADSHAARAGSLPALRAMFAAAPPEASGRLSRLLSMHPAPGRRLAVLNTPASLPVLPAATASALTVILWTFGTAILTAAFLATPLEPYPRFVAGLLAGALLATTWTLALWLRPEILSRRADGDRPAGVPPRAAILGLAAGVAAGALLTLDPAAMLTVAGAPGWRVVLYLPLATAGAAGLTLALFTVRRRPTVAPAPALLAPDPAAPAALPPAVPSASAALSPAEPSAPAASLSAASYPSAAALPSMPPSAAGSAAAVSSSSATPVPAVPSTAAASLPVEPPASVAADSALPVSPAVLGRASPPPPAVGSTPQAAERQVPPLVPVITDVAPGPGVSTHVDGLSSSSSAAGAGSVDSGDARWFGLPVRWWRRERGWLITTALSVPAFAGALWIGSVLAVPLPLALFGLPDGPIGVLVQGAFYAEWRNITAVGMVVLAIAVAAGLGRRAGSVAVTGLLAGLTALATRWLLPINAVEPYREAERDWWTAAAAGFAVILLLLCLRGAAGLGDALLAAPIAALTVSAGVLLRYLPDFEDPLHSAWIYAVRPLAMLAMLTLTVGVAAGLLPSRAPASGRGTWLTAAAGAGLAATLTVAILLAGDPFLSVAG